MTSDSQFDIGIVDIGHLVDQLQCPWNQGNMRTFLHTPSMDEYEAILINSYPLYFSRQWTRTDFKVQYSFSKNYNILGYTTLHSTYNSWTAYQEMVTSENKLLEMR